MESDVLGLKATLHLRNCQAAQTVKNLLAMEESWVQSLRWEEPLEKGMTTHSSFLTWRIPWTEEPGLYYSPWGCKEWTRLNK